MSEWKITGSRVHGYGKSFNCTNKINATDLYNTLTIYEETVKTTHNTNTKLDKIEQQIIAIQMDISNVQSTLDTIKETLKQ